MLKRQIPTVIFAIVFSGTCTSEAIAGGMDFFFSGSSQRAAQHAPLVSPFPTWASSAAPRDKAPISPPIKSSISQEDFKKAPPKQQALLWFESFDDIIFTMGPSDHEKFILKRPIDQDSERLKEWINATNSMARKYRLIAKKIRSMSLSQPIADIREFQTEAANWYDDNAQLCEDLTAPRRPAKTYEELERAYNNFMVRARNLSELAHSITELNTKLRDRYDVHQPKYTDPSAKYIDSVVHQVQEK